MKEQFTIYDAIDLVARKLSKHPEKLKNYLLCSLDDDGGFLRSCYCQKSKNLENRVLSKGVTHLVVGFMTPFGERKVSFIPWVDVDPSIKLTNFKVQICFSWVEDIEGTIEMCEMNCFEDCRVFNLKTEEEETDAFTTPLTIRNLLYFSNYHNIVRQHEKDPYIPFEQEITSLLKNDGEYLYRQGSLSIEDEGKRIVVDRQAGKHITKKSLNQEVEKGYWVYTELDRYLILEFFEDKAEALKQYHRNLKQDWIQTVLFIDGYSRKCMPNDSHYPPKEKWVKPKRKRKTSIVF